MKNSKKLIMLFIAIGLCTNSLYSFWPFREDSMQTAARTATKAADTAKYAAQAADTANKTVNTVTQQTLPAISQTLDAAKEVITLAKEPTKNLAEAVTGFGKTLPDAVKTTENLRDFGNNIFNSSENLKKTVPELAKSLDNASESIIGTGQRVGELNETIKAAVPAFTDSVNKLETIANKFQLTGPQIFKGVAGMGFAVIGLLCVHDALLNPRGKERNWKDHAFIATAGATSLGISWWLFNNLK